MEVTMRLKVRWPWWTQPYLRLLTLAARLGCEIDIKKAGDRLVRHLKVQCA